MNLFLNGIVDEFHDLDFIIELSDTEKVKEVMEKIGAILKETGGNGYCESDVYMHFQLERVDIDIISHFTQKDHTILQKEVSCFILQKDMVFAVILYSGFEPN